MDGRFTWEGVLNRPEQLRKTFCKESRRSLQLRGNLIEKCGCIFPARQDRQTVVHEPFILRAVEKNAKATSYAVDSFYCINAARGLEKDTERRVECSA